MKTHELQAYVEAEMVAGEGAFSGKPFDPERYDALVPVIQYTAGKLGETALFVPCGGETRSLPAKVFQRNPSTVLEIPTTEFHLTVNPRYCDERLLRVLDGMGLLGYGVNKVMMNQKGELAVDPAGKLIVVQERPLTLRHAQKSATDFQDFLAITGLVLHIVRELGGIAEPTQLGSVAKYYPATFKIERLVTFEHRGLAPYQIPPIMDRATIREDVRPPRQVAQGISDVARYMKEIGMICGGLSLGAKAK